MTLLDLADMLADVLETEDVYAGNIDGNLDSCIGVYSSKKQAQHIFCIGGGSCTKTREKNISILIHHTDNPTSAEGRAQEVLGKLSALRNKAAGSATVRYMRLMEPQSAGRDERGICEYVIEATVYYEESEE